MTDTKKVIIEVDVPEKAEIHWVTYEYVNKYGIRVQEDTGVTRIIDEPVVWLHDDPKRFDVIHAEVKELLQKAGGHLHRPLDKTERYTVPLYTRPQPASTVAVPRDLVDRLIHQGYTYADIDALRKLLAQEDKE